MILSMLLFQHVHAKLVQDLRQLKLSQYQIQTFLQPVVPRVLQHEPFL